MITDVKWNYDAADKNIVFVHIYADKDEKLVLEIEKKRSDRRLWRIHHKQFDIKVKNDY